MSTLTPAEKPEKDFLTNLAFNVMMIAIIGGFALAIGYVIFSFFQ